jgi:uncharacterized protein
MGEVRTYPEGVPSWIDIEPADVEAACAFYGGLFGWTFEQAAPAGTPGSYLIAQLDGHDVAGIGTPTGDARDGGRGGRGRGGGGGTTAWNTYIAVDDADRVTAAAEAAGGRVVESPDDGGPGGRGAVLVDPTGAPFRLWQARGRPGAQVANAPGSWNFSDLHTIDVVAARAFYGAVFGWEADELDVGGQQPVVLWRRPGYGQHLGATVNPHILDVQAEVGAPPGFEDAVAWLVAVRPGEPTRWHVTFAVADRDDAVAEALRLGATDLSGPVYSRWTRATEVRDPQGAILTLSQFAPPSS